MVKHYRQSSQPPLTLRTHVSVLPKPGANPRATLHSSVSQLREKARSAATAARATSSVYAAGGTLRCPGRKGRGDLSSLM